MDESSTTYTGPSINNFLSPLVFVGDRETLIYAPTSTTPELVPITLKATIFMIGGRSVIDETGF